MKYFLCLQGQCQHIVNVAGKFIVIATTFPFNVHATAIIKNKLCATKFIKKYFVVITVSNDKNEYLYT